MCILPKLGETAYLPGFIGQIGEIPRIKLEFITPARNFTKCPKMERATKNGEIMIYDINGKSNILPSEVERRLEISLTRTEVEEGLSGNELYETASLEVINSAKSDIERAIGQLAMKENIQLSDSDKDRLANFSIMLMKKIAAAV